VRRELPPRGFVLKDMKIGIISDTHDRAADVPVALAICCNGAPGCSGRFEREGYNPKSDQKVLAMR
jgi:hypothetical protein